MTARSVDPPPIRRPQPLDTKLETRDHQRHSRNLEALQAVLSDIAAQQVDQIYCLGDIIGYGPNPV
jgi:hypothetical protein